VVFFFGSQWDPMVGLCHKPLKRCDFVRPRSSPRNVRRAHRWWMTSSKKTSGTWECHKNLTSKEGRDPQDPQDPSDKSFFTNWWKKTMGKNMKKYHDMMKLGETCEYCYQSGCYCVFFKHIVGLKDIRLSFFFE
jgi:hypothetical protein